MQRILALIICYLVVSLVGCGDDTVVIDHSADALIGEGWAEYDAGNYGDAIAKFSGALATNPPNSEAIDCDNMLADVEAYDGIAWSQARLGQTSDSIDSFKMAIEKGSANSDVCEDEARARLVYFLKDTYAGLAGMYLVENDYEQAIASAGSFFSISSDVEYSSRHDDIDEDDVHILLAECYYNTGDYVSAGERINLVGSSGQRLDPSSPTYLADLLSVIEELSGEGL